MSNFRYLPPKNAPVESNALLNDLRSVVQKLGTVKLSARSYVSHGGKFDPSTIIRRFGTWKNALSQLGIGPGNINIYSDDDLFENILRIWQYKGRQPVRRDLEFEPSTISQSPYGRRFKSWSNALSVFVQHANESEGSIVTTHTARTTARKTGRDPSLRLRFRVLMRDSFSCKNCGASPAKQVGILLHVDHIVPWSKGGETVESNLQTLCQDCNAGKSDLL